MKFKEIIDEYSFVKKQYIANILCEKTGFTIDALKLPEKIEDFDDCTMHHIISYYRNGEHNIQNGILYFKSKENNKSYSIINYEAHPELAYYELKNIFSYFKRLNNIYNSLPEELKLKIELEEGTNEV